MPRNRSYFSLLLTAAICCPLPAHAVKFRVTNAPPPGLMLSIGSGGSKIDEVSFKLKSGELGNGVPIRGNPPVRIVVANRATPANSRMAVLTADSSIPLRNNSHTVPFSVISWISSDGSVPSGRFDSSSNQFLFAFGNSQQFDDKHWFYYENAGVLEAGTYTGRVVYTLTMP